MTAPSETDLSAPQAGETRSFAGMEFCWCPPGTFLMGSPEDEPDRSSDEGSQRKVTFPQGFWMGKYEVTQEQWKAVMGDNPSTNTENTRFPVTDVSWGDCQEFIQRLNAKGAGTFRLPSEAQWEYACRAGTTTAFAFGDTLSKYQVCYDGAGTMPVGSFKPNPWGLYDMHGNVSEWCQDWYHNTYHGAPADGRAWESPAGAYRVLRGGSWLDRPGNCRAAYRDYDDPDGRYVPYGFRLLRTP